MSSKYRSFCYSVNFSAAQVLLPVHYSDLITLNSIIASEKVHFSLNFTLEITNSVAINEAFFLSVPDAVRLREQRPRDQRSYSSRRSSTDSSEDGFNLNVRDLKVRSVTQLFDRRRGKASIKMIKNLAAKTKTL